MDDAQIQNLCGWAHEIAEDEFARLSDNFVTFMCDGGLTEPGPPIWEAAKRVNDGKHLETWFQETGDCVSMGASQATEYLNCYEIAVLKDEEEFHRIFPPFVYGISRCAPDCGNGQLGRQAGSTGAWAATAMMKYGMLFVDDEGCPRYSGNLADSWGRRGPPDQFKGIARDNLVKQASRLTSTDQMRTGLINYNPCTYAIMWDYGDSAVEYKGYRVMRKGRGMGGHQVCLLAWMDEPFEAAFCLNSWGKERHAGPNNGEPLGGAWILRQDLERDLQSGQTEVYGLSGFSGVAGKEWWGLFGQH